MSNYEERQYEEEMAALNRRLRKKDDEEYEAKKRKWAKENEDDYNEGCRLRDLFYPN
jgi:hypothetical protein